MTLRAASGPNATARSPYRARAAQPRARRFSRGKSNRTEFVESSSFPVFFRCSLLLLLFFFPLVLSRLASRVRDPSPEVIECDAAAAAAARGRGPRYGFENNNNAPGHVTRFKRQIMSLL